MPLKKKVIATYHKTLHLYIFQVLWKHTFTSFVLTIDLRQFDASDLLTIPILQRSKLSSGQIHEKEWHGAELALPKLE